MIKLFHIILQPLRKNSRDNIHSQRNTSHPSPKTFRISKKTILNKQKTEQLLRSEPALFLSAATKFGLSATFLILSQESEENYGEPHAKKLTENGELP